MAGRAVDAGKRGYVRLPDDDVLLEIFYRLERDRFRTADELGCSEAAVGYRLKRIMETTGVDHRPLRRIRSNRRQRELELVAKVGELEARIEALEARPLAGPTRVVEWRPNHRRRADGGLNTNVQRKAFVRSVRRQEAAS